MACDGNKNISGPLDYEAGTNIVLELEIEDSLIWINHYLSMVHPLPFDFSTFPLLKAEAFGILNFVGFLPHGK